LTGRKLVQCGCYNREIGTCLRFIEPQQDIARLDAIAVFHEKLAHHAARRMLNLLDVRVDDKLARRDHCTREFGRRCPAADAEDEHDGSRSAHEKMTVDGA
jgi:hypothetical protein